METLLLPGCHVSYIITNILPETHLQGKRRKSYDGQTIYSPRNAVQNIILHMIQIGRTNARKLWRGGDLYYATATQKLPFAIKKRKRKETFVFLFAPSSWPKAYLLISSPGDNESMERTSVYKLCPIPHICHFFTLAKFLENKIYTEIYTVNCQFTQ